ncbi:MULTISPECIES: hypothetical protein [Enterococcus]|nr:MULTISPECIES: hypothetical protein [Enterococcus]PQD41512.1 hypothetical protein CUM72_01550 [Enterococcus durans]TKN13820.1 hypothetical protein DVW83_14280 [Enterococcus sp. VV15]
MKNKSYELRKSGPVDKNIKKKILDEFFDGRLRSIRKLEVKYKVARNCISMWVKDEYRNGRKIENIESEMTKRNIYTSKEKQVFLISYLTHPDITIDAFAKQNNIPVTTFSKWLYDYRNEKIVKKVYSTKEKLKFINLYKQTNGQSTITAFTERYGLAKSTFLYWLRKDKEERLGQKSIVQILKESREEFDKDKGTSKTNLEDVNRKQQVTKKQINTSMPTTNKSSSLPSESLDEWLWNMPNIEEIRSMPEQTTSTNEGHKKSSQNSLESLSTLYSKESLTNLETTQKQYKKLPTIKQSVDKQSLFPYLNSVKNKNEQSRIERRQTYILPKTQFENPAIILNINGPMFFFNMDSKVEGLETINILKNNLFETLQKCFTDSNNKEDEIYSNNITVS